ncbi:uncharacterized protein LOC144094947 [Amblyomma americanum]
MGLSVSKGALELSACSLGREILCSLALWLPYVSEFFVASSLITCFLMEALIKPHLQGLHHIKEPHVVHCEELAIDSTADDSATTKKPTLRVKIKGGTVFSPYDSANEVPSSLYALITERLSCHGNKTALIEGNRAVKYNELMSKLRRYAAGFQAHGVGPGDRVYCHCGNSIESFVALYSIALAGATIVLSDPEYKTGEVQKHMKDTDATHILTDVTHAFKFNNDGKPSPIKAHFATSSLPGFISVCSFDAYGEDDYKKVEPEPARTIVMAYTSGSTGAPKNIEITEGRFVRKICGMGATGIYAADDVCLACEHLTIYLSFSFNLKFICCGAVLVISSKYWSVPDFIQTAGSNQVTLLMTTPSVLSLLANGVIAAGVRLPSLKKVVSLGAVLSKTTAMLVQSAFSPSEFRNVYGLSEASGVVCCPGPGQISPDSVGFPVAETEIKVVDTKTGSVLGPKECGEILVRSQYIMTTYYKNSQATAAAIDADGWLRTGDIGYYDASGRLFVTGRLKSIIKCMDTKVDPFEVEQCLLELKPVAEAAVLGVPHPFFGEAPAAIVVLQEGYAGDLEQLSRQLKDHVAGKLAVYKQLYGGIAFATKLPKNRRGKLLRRCLLDEFLNFQKLSPIY